MENCYSYEDLKLVIDTQYKSFSDFNTSCIQYIENVNDANFKDYQKILAKQGEKGEFNLFEVIYPNWWYENFHSKMLRFLLESYPDFFDNFLVLIGAKENYQSRIIECETDRIDITIRGEKHVIIIENKLNWAGDQNNQIYRYYKKMKETQKLEVDKIVYLSPSKYKEASANSLDCDIEESITKEEYIKDINKKLIHLIGFDAGNKDLVSCLEKTEKNSLSEDKRVFLNHYIEILKQKGVGDMSIIASKFFDEIKKSEDKEIGKKLAYMKEMLDGIPAIRQEFWLNKFADSEKNGKNFIIKVYEPTDGNYQIDIYCNNFDYTRVYISPSDNYNKDYLSKLKTILENANIEVESEQHDGGWYKDFKFPTEDDAALEFVQKVDAILSNLKTD